MRLAATVLLGGVFYFGTIVPGYGMLLHEFLFLWAF
jgi:hypothetical protein